MMIKNSWIIFSILSAFVFVPVLPPFAVAAGPQSYLSVKILLNKSEYALGEPVAGTVEINNTLGANQAATFDMMLFREDELEQQVMTGIKAVRSGANVYSFQDFGLSTMMGGIDTPGRWRLFILQKDVDRSYAAEADFAVLPEARPEAAAVEVPFENHSPPQEGEVWITYLNPKAGFEIQLPKGFSIFPMKSSVEGNGFRIMEDNLSLPSTMDIRLPGEADPPSPACASPGISGVEVSTVDVAGRQGRKLAVREPWSEFYCLPGLEITYSRMHGRMDEVLAEKIISTFRFVP
ncbi:MAG: hypothetical protein Q8Q08_02580 [Candidatus Omnitrophota bacterium]|nr:hypothetical protein [Candidatus Omnitrophota bacterium]MDZ4243426.1 hypothetical protein [Candidatus Omnitrophota bacterium]